MEKHKQVYNKRYACLTVQFRFCLMLLTTVLYEGYSTELVRIEKKKKEIEKVLSFLTNCDLNSSLKLSLISMKVLVKYQKTNEKTTTKNWCLILKTHKTLPTLLLSGQQGKLWSLDIPLQLTNFLTKRSVTFCVLFTLSTTLPQRGVAYCLC